MFHNPGVQLRQAEDCGVRHTHPLQPMLRAIKIQKMVCKNGYSAPGGYAIIYVGGVAAVLTD
jgi:hypothetical protein